MKPFTRDTLHVYASEHPHEEAFLTGTPDALRRLRDAIDRALENKRPECAVVYASDGEGHAVVVQPCEDMTGVVVPYATMHDNQGRQVWLSGDDQRRIGAELRAGKGMHEVDTHNRRRGQ